MLFFANRYLLLATLLAICVAAPVSGQEQNSRNTPVVRDSQDAAEEHQDEVLETLAKGTPVRLVDARDPKADLAKRLFWRTFREAIAAETVPSEIRIDNRIICASQLTGDELETGPLSKLGPTHGYARFDAQEHIIHPGKIRVALRGTKILSMHPAVRVVQGKVSQEVLLSCIPVTFYCKYDDGHARPAVLKLACRGQSLLRDPLRISRFTIWLPVGNEYASSMGIFTIDAEGKVAVRGKLPQGVEFTGREFRRTARAAVSKMLAPRPSEGEFVTLRGPKPFRVYVSNWLEPGEPLRLAVSREAYIAAVGQEFEAAHFRTATRGTAPVAATEASAPSAAIVQKVAKILTAAPTDIAWFQLAVEPQLGANTVSVQTELSRTFSHRYLVANRGRGLYLLPYRWRSVFSEREASVYHVIAGSGCAGGIANLVAERSDGTGEPLVLGTLALPAVSGAGYDARSFRLQMSALPIGKYRMHVRLGDSKSQRVPLQIVPWRQRSSFLVHSMTWGGTWPTSDQGLAAIHDAGVDMVAQGHNLDQGMPAVDERLTWYLRGLDSGVPAEMALARSGNDAVLQRLLQHQVRHLDFAVTRDASFYNEGLSYHHSYQPSVDRMVRRMQIFAQQTADYPSAAGMNYSWYPQMYGYVEGGVATDAHTADRNRSLAENLREAGHTGITRDERQWYMAHRKSRKPEELARAKQLQRKDLVRWKAAYQVGFGKHNRIYNAAVREVRPDATLTLYENAGHDSGKRPASLFGDMAASSYFTMTDFGDWPMSAGFTTDWARAQSPEKPVWLTTERLSSTEGQTKALFHAFGRGLGGGGLAMHDRYSMKELARRGKVLNFLSQYGAIATSARPDRRVSILATDAKLRFHSHGAYDYHAAYYHLTRLGYPPELVSQETVEKGGVPNGVKVLLLVGVEHPLTQQTTQAIRAFQKSGGRVVTLGAAVAALADTIHVDVPVRSIWKGPGFHMTAHTWMWEQFGALREPLQAGLRQAGLEPVAAVDSEHGYALSLDAGPIRYVVVIADSLGTHVGQFKREANLALSLEGVGWTVRDLRSQETLAVQTSQQRTEVVVNLDTEPATILALYKQQPQEVELRISSGPRLGSTVAFAAAAPHPVPVRLRLLAPDGGTRGVWYRAAGEQVTANLPAYDQPGQWRLECQELLTGLTTVSSIKVPGVKTKQAATAIGDVHVVNERLLRDFVRRTDETLVIVEPGREDLLPLAEDFVRNLHQAGMNARLWHVEPHEFDNHPLRWYLRQEDTERLATIKKGKLIGYRQNLQAYIDRSKRAHVPERGGYAAIDPPYMIGKHCIVFSGGPLAESLRSVSAWMETPNVPGRGQGRLVVALSPFMANRDVLALVANDPQGLRKAANEVVVACRSKEPTSPRIVKTEPSLVLRMESRERTPVRRPYQMLTPHRRVKELLATPDGRAVVILRDEGGTVFLDADGNVNAAVQIGGLNPHIDRQGRLWDLVETAEGPTKRFTLRCTQADGTVHVELAAYRATTRGWPGVPGMGAGFVASPDGEIATLGRQGRILFGRLAATDNWKFYDDTPFADQRFAVFYPRMPVSAAFSPEGRYLCVSLDTRPPINNMSGPVFRPMFGETLLIDTRSGNRIWSLRDDTRNRSTYIAHRGFVAVARNARRTALADYDGGIFVVDNAGKRLIDRPAENTDRTANNRLRPAGGVGVAISDAGELAAFGYQNRLVIYADGSGGLHELPMNRLMSLCVSGDGSQVVVATEDGEVIAVDPGGRVRWRRKFDSAGLHLAATRKNETLVGTSDGLVLLLDFTGGEVRRTEVFERARAIVQPPRLAEDVLQLPLPQIYLPPDTLDVARRQLGAKQVAQWHPTGRTVLAFGKKLFQTTMPIKLSTQANECFLHLVYRRPPENKTLVIKTNSNDGSEVFELDLPTPTWRVVDIPLRGPEVAVTIQTVGPVQILNCSLWSFQWPGANLAYVKPAGFVDKKVQPKTTGLSDDLLSELTDETSGVSGRVKTCRIWWPNTDPDRIKGSFLVAPLDPLSMVDRRRFGGGKVRPWSSGRSTRWGASLTINFGQPTDVSLVATYDRVQKQSQLSRSLMVFNGPIKREHDSPPALAAAMHNDQFWRLFDFPTTKVQTLGVHVFAGTGPDGLSEVEVYRVRSRK